MGFGGIIAGALGGAGRAVEDIGTMRLGQIAQKERDERLAEIAREAQERGFRHAEGMQATQIAATERQGEATRKQAKELHGETIAHQEKMGQAQMNLQVMLADMHEKAATQRHGQSMGLQIKQMEQALKLAELNKPLQVNEKGEFFYRDSNGNTQFIYDPSAPEGGRMKSPKDLTSREKAVLEAHANAVVAQVRELAKDPLTDPKVKAEQIAALVQSLHTPQGAATPQQQKPTDAHVDALKKRASDPKARAAFDQQFGAGAADKVLGAKKQEDPPTANAGAGMVEKAMSPYISPYRGGFRIDGVPARSPVSALSGKIYGTREEAQRAIDDLLR